MKSSNVLRTASGLLVTSAVLLPWLNPFASGPSPYIVPWLVALMAAGNLLLLASLSTFNEGVVDGVPFSPLVAFPAASAWLLAGVLSTAIALLQYFGATGFFEPWVNHAALGEAFANLRQRNQFATLANIALAALVWFAVVKRSAHRASIRWEWVAIVLGGVLAVGNAASQSRTGLAQLGLACALSAIWGLWRNQMVRKILMAAVITYALAAILLPLLGGFDLATFGMAARLRAGDLPCASRSTLWSNVLHLIAQKPWFGWGWGELDYAHYMTLYDGPRFCDILDNAHNLPLHLAVELGIPVALLICGSFTWWVVRQKPWQEVEPTRQLAWSVLAVILLHSMLEYPLWYGPFQMAFGLCLMMLWRQPMPASKVSDTSTHESNSDLVRVTTGLIAIFMIAGSAYAAWDYRRVSQIYASTELREPAYRVDTLGKIKGSWLFSDQVQFAELLMTPLTRQNAQWTFKNATALLHFSPEPRVIERVIESATMLGRDEEAAAHLARYRAAFSQDYAKWKLANARTAAGLEGGKLQSIRKD